MTYDVRSEIIDIVLDAVVVASEPVEVISEMTEIQWLKKCPHVSQILKDSVIARHILNIRPNAWWLT